MSGVTTAIEVAEAGFEAHIVEKNPYLGGRVAQINKYFWKLCPPNCGLEIQFKRIKNNSRIKFYTLAEVESIQGEEGNFDVTINLSPRYVNDKCVGCNACAEACPSFRENDFNFGMDKTKAAYLPHEQAFPFKYVIDAKTCSKDCMKACVEACKYNAIDREMKPEKVNIKVGAVVLATGWNPYDMEQADERRVRVRNRRIEPVEQPEVAVRRVDALASHRHVRAAQEYGQIVCACPPASQRGAR